MVYLAIFILIFTAMQFTIALANLLFGQAFPKPDPNDKPLVSVLIPARNEEKNIGNLLSDLSAQDYQELEILVFDDQSADRTPEIIGEFVQKDRRFHLIHSDGLPDGWLGKNHACHQLASRAGGHFFLFLDADVRIGKHIIAQTTAMLKHYQLDLLSIFPRQLMKTAAEWMTVPLMNYILLSLLPLILVRKSGFPSLAAANGQFMLFDVAVYKQTQPHRRWKTSKVEDIEIARDFKKQMLKVACLTGNQAIQCRMYEGFMEAVNGFSKNVTHFFGNSTLLAILFWLVTSFGFLAIVFGLPSIFVLIYFGLYLFTRILISLVSRQSPLKNLLFIVPQQIAMGLFILKAITNTFKKQYVWKGRSISS